MKNIKSLGQHWLKDREVLGSIAELAKISPNDTVLEIGPGLGTLTSVLLSKANKVIAVEFDPELARKLPDQFPGKNLEVINQDILSFDLESLPKGYKVVANVPYYITSKIVSMLVKTSNKPISSVILVQKEVAERIAAKPGNYSLLALSAQIYTRVRLGPIVKAEMFTPPPKVDSQVVVLETRDTPLVSPEDEKALFHVARAGFASKRKKLRSSISAGLAISKPAAEELLAHAGIDSDKRAEDLSIDEWLQLARDAV